VLSLRGLWVNTRASGSEKFRQADQKSASLFFSTLVVCRATAERHADGRYDNLTNMSYAPFTSAPLLNQTTSGESSTVTVGTPAERRPTRVKSDIRPGTKSRSDYPIIVHCHLCWDWVWQRPQQFMSRFSHRHRVLFIETLAPDENLVTPLAQIRRFEKWPNLTLLRLQFPTARWHDGAWVDRERRRLVKQALRGPLRGQFNGAVQWFYDPMAVTAFAGQLREIATVYDCMDELSQFKGAPPEMRAREAELLARADVVFTGGRRMWESKSRHNPNCHFYGCGVDVPHFSKARSAATAIPDDIAALPKPVLGYFGVVDERIDYDLLAQLAAANPTGSIVMVGPTAKVDPAALPRAKNLHWLGGRDYGELPAYCKGFDACLMPFALNAATEYINPTKALEYMAAGRPIVSSAIYDVVKNFGSVVHVANSHAEFLELCHKAVTRADASRIQEGLEMASANSWESIVEKMEGHIAEALAVK
jgi:glycosyltransferase involved in cell wall biosynthesis